MKTRISLWSILCLFILSACVPQNPVISPTDRPLIEEDTPVPPSITELPSGQPAETLLPTTYTMWVAPYLPKEITKGLVAPVTLEIVDDPAQAQIRLDIGIDQPVTWLVYALVAPFPSLDDEVSLDNLMRAWQGRARGLLAEGHLNLTEQTRKVFSSWWGEPAGDFVQVLNPADLLTTTWAEAPAWALVPFQQIEPRWKVLQIDGKSPLWKSFVPEEYALSVPVGLEGDIPDVVEQVRFGLSASLPAPLNRNANKLTTVILTGVTALVRATAVEMENYGILYPAEDVGPILRDADITHISNEVPFAEACPPPVAVNDRLIFCSSPAYMELLEAVGTDVVELTGDHFSDWGTQATLYTFDLYDEKGWLYYGGGRTPDEGRKPITIEDHGNKIAFIGCNGKGGAYTPSVQGLPGAVDCDFDLIKNEIQRLKQEGYVVIMTFQHHEVYAFDPGPTLYEDFQLVAEAGADIVSGSQAHQPHGMTFYNDQIIMYGLGNLFFDQLLMGENTSRAMIARHIIYNGEYINTEIITIYFSDFSRPRFLLGEERQRLLSQLFGASHWGDMTYQATYP